MTILMYFLTVFLFSDNRKECLDYNLTTTAEVSDPSDDEVDNKRIRKKKRYGKDFQTGWYYDVIYSWVLYCHHCSTRLTINKAKADVISFFFLI